MQASSPHFLLFSESDITEPTGQWRFVLQSVDGSETLEASDLEPEMSGERLELLAVVRGLEALPQPSTVTLVTPSRYVDRGLNDGLAQWRNNGWQWERFGSMVPVKNRDLWQRIDRALKFHQIVCRRWRFDAAHTGPAGPSGRSATASPDAAAEPASRGNLGERHSGHGMWARMRGTMASCLKPLACGARG